MRSAASPRFADHLADDHAIGQAVRRTGLSVVLAPNLVTHRCVERSAGQLFQHELRWARTIRAIDPAGFAGSVVMHPLPFALVATLLPGKAYFGIATLAATLICRGTLQWQVDRSLGRVPGSIARRHGARTGPRYSLFLRLLLELSGQRGGVARQALSGPARRDGG